MVDYFVYHVQIFIPPTLSELKVDDNFQELPSWKVTHFSWLIAWRWRIHMAKIVHIIFQILFFKGTFRNHFVILLSISPLHDDGLIVDLHVEEEQCGGLIDEIASLHLEEIIIEGCYRGRRRKELSLSLHLLEDKKSLRGEDCNIPKFACSKLEN